MISKKTRRKMSEDRKRKFSGKNHFMYGKHLSEETRRKISEAMKGEKNPMFGKHPTLKPRNTSFRRRKKKVLEFR